MAEEEDNKKKQLERKKANILDSLDLLEQYVKVFDEQPSLRGQVEAWAERLEKIFKQFEEITVSLELAKQERMKIEARYYVLRAFYLGKLHDACKPPGASHSPPSKTVSVKLPKLNLPKFSGRLEDWCVFRDAFESSIGSRSDINPVDKMQYLKGLVEGEAARILDPIKISAQGYKDAWRTLRLRFDNKRQLIKCHLRTLFDTPAMKRESAEELLALVDRFEQQLSVLKSLGEPADGWSSVLVYHLSIRLDQSTLREWESHCTRLDSENVASVLGGSAREESSSDDNSSSMPSYVSMVNFLQNYARVLVAVPPVVPPPHAPPRSTSKPWESVSYSASTSPAAVSTSSSSPSSSVGTPTMPCVKCGRGHCGG